MDLPVKVLITGGAGFIGSHIARGVAARGWDPVILDDLSTGSRAAIPTGVELVLHDISRSDTADVVALIGADVVIHAAAQVSVARSMADPARDRAVNVVGTERVLEGSERGGAQRIVFLSSGGAVYGEASGAAEDDAPRPASYYGAHKWVAERYVELSRIPHGIARIANVYGPGQRSDLEGGVVAIFKERLLAGDAIVVHGDGEQVRDFIHVEDVVDAVLAMASSERSSTWNVGTSRETSVLGLLYETEGVLRRTATVTFGPARPGDVRRSSLDIGRIRSQLGWRPRLTLAEGLRRSFG